MSAHFTFVDANGFSDRVLRWELLVNNMAPLLEERPYLKPLYEEFVRRLEEVKALEFELKSVQVQAKKLVLARRARMKEGEEMRTRLASALAFEHGPKSVRLNQFGVKPRRGGRPRKKVETAPEGTPAAGAEVGGARLR